MLGDGKTRFADPVIVLALPRSFSSLTCAMLGQHPQMYDLLETQLFEVDTIEEWWEQYGETHDSDGLTRVVAEVLFGDQGPRHAQMARQWLWDRRRWGSADIAWLLAEKLFPLALVEKTPVEHASKERIREKLHRRLRTFPKARFLHVARNPITYGQSHLEHLEKMSKTGHPWRMAERYRMMLDRSTKPPTVDPQILWFRVNSLIAEFLEALPDKQKMSIRGEDLVSNPDATARELTEWLGMRSDDRAIEEMKHPENSPFACLGPRNAMFGGDPKFFRDPSLRCHHPSVDGLTNPLPWRQDKGRLQKDVLELADAFGYKRRAAAIARKA